MGLGKIHFQNLAQAQGESVLIQHIYKARAQQIGNVGQIQQSNIS